MFKAGETYRNSNSNQDDMFVFAIAETTEAYVQLVVSWVGRETKLRDASKGIEICKIKKKEFQNWTQI